MNVIKHISLRCLNDWGARALFPEALPPPAPSWSYLWDAALSDLNLLGCDLALWDGDLKGLGLSHNSRGGQKAGEGN